ncbi:MAG: hypothetical protein FJZ96_00335 [Chloroflexi bacterium]|nr:hypothetical protein [Chloroflexota bacterium]
MKKNAILLLGATGNTGGYLASLLLEYSSAALKVASRSETKAAVLAEALNRRFPGGRASPAVVDAASPASLAAALPGTDLLVAASSTSAHVEAAAGACLSAGVDYFDVQYSASKVAFLQSQAGAIENARRCFITDGGFHPGLPAVLVRWGAARFDQLTSANVGSVIKIDWRPLEIGPETVAEMIGEFGAFQSFFYKEGRWKKARMDIVVDHIKMDFGPPFGRQVAAPMMLEEMRRLPESIPGLRETGFFVGGFNWFTDWFIMPLGMIVHKVSRPAAEKFIGPLLLWSLKTFSHPPYDTRLKLEAGGRKDGEERALHLLLSHPDGYFFTAAPAAAAILQWLDGTIRKPGLYTQGEIVEPERLLKDIEQMGISVKQAWYP